jgi:hypothetical protein
VLRELAFVYQATRTVREAIAGKNTWQHARGAATAAHSEREGVPPTLPIFV